MKLSQDFLSSPQRDPQWQLSQTVEFMQELSRYSDPEELYGVFSKRMQKVFPTDRQISVSMRKLANGQYKVTRSHFWDGCQPQDVDLEGLISEGGIVADWFAAASPQMIDSMQLDDDDPAQRFLFGQKSIVVLPLFDNGSANTMVILSRAAERAFTLEQMPELVWLSNFFARTTQTLWLSQQLRVAYESADYELRKIAELQQSLLPKRIPEICGLDVGAYMKTAHRAGGDYYDFFKLPESKLGILIADVSGHGSSAAILMAITHSLSHALEHSPTKPGEFLSYLNYHLSKRYTVTTGHFVTAIYAVIDSYNGTLCFANAGHSAPLYRRAGAKFFYALDAVKRLPLGVTHRSQSPYPEQLIVLQPGDEFCLYTDGITEATNGEGEYFGQERLDLGFQDSSVPAQRMVDRLIEHLDDFTAEGNSDDRTLVFLRRTLEHCQHGEFRADSALTKTSRADTILTD